MVAFLPLDPTDDDSIDMVLTQIDFAIQYGEDVEPKEMVEDLMGQEAQDRGVDLQ